MIHVATPSAINLAARTLVAGDLLGLPTETVYGLAADATNAHAVAKIFAAKGRPSDHPLIVHLMQTDHMHAWAQSVPPYAQALAHAFWPGPLTLIVTRAAHVLDCVTGGQNTVGLRVPAHPVAQAVLQAFTRLKLAEQAVKVEKAEKAEKAAKAAKAKQAELKTVSDVISKTKLPTLPTLPTQPMVPIGLAAPSANQFGRISPTRAQHVADELGDDLLILDGGSASIGIESTIVDCTGAAPRVLRPGHITAAQIEATFALSLRSSSNNAETIAAMPKNHARAVFEHRSVVSTENTLVTPSNLEKNTAAWFPPLPVPRVSGSLAAHYAPRTPMLLLDTSALKTEIAQRRSCIHHSAAYATRLSNQTSSVHTPQRIAVYAFDTHELRDCMAGATETKTECLKPHLDFFPASTERSQFEAELYQQLRALDHAAYDLLLIEMPPIGAEWEGVRDRLTRAAVGAGNPII